MFESPLINDRIVATLSTAVGHWICVVGVFGSEFLILSSWYNYCCASAAWLYIGAPGALLGAI